MKTPDDYRLLAAFAIASANLAEGMTREDAVERRAINLENAARQDYIYRESADCLATAYAVALGLA